MERTGVLARGAGVNGAQETRRSVGPVIGGGAAGLGEDPVLAPAALNRLAEAAAALKAVSLEGLDEEGLCRVVAGARKVKALAEAVTVRAAGGLEALAGGLGA